MEPGSGVSPTEELVWVGMLLHLGGLCSGTKQFSLKSRTRRALPARWQPTAPCGCAVEGKWCHSPQAGALGAVLDKASMLWCSHQHTQPPASRAHQGARRMHLGTPHDNLLPVLAGTLPAAPG